MRSDNKQVLVNDLHWEEPRSEKCFYLKTAFNGEIVAKDNHVI